MKRFMKEINEGVTACQVNIDGKMAYFVIEIKFKSIIQMSKKLNLSIMTIIREWNSVDPVWYTD